MRLVYWILAVCFFTASFDIFLVLNLGGTVRISQLFLGFLCILALAKIIQNGQVLWPRGSTMLALWLLSQVLFLPLSGVLTIGIQFLALLTLTIVGVFAVIQLYAASGQLDRVMRLYIWSFLFVAAFGLVQFALPLLNLPSPLVMQWFVHGRLARINGFCYEPSYYATYLMLGWIMLVDLRRSNARIVKGRNWKWLTFMVGASLFLSTSRTGWIVMFLELVARTFPLVKKGVRSVLHQSRHGQMLITLPRSSFIFGSLLLAMVTAVAAVGMASLPDPLIFLAGTGLAGTAAHSYNGRSDRAVQTFEAFKDHPVTGHSLGGVAVYLAERQGIAVHSIDEARIYEGFPVPFEILVASGAIGAIPFFLYIYRNTLGAMRLARSRWPDERARWLRALGRAMIFECIMLCTDQNILRVYVWFHLTMVMMVAYSLEFVRYPEADAVPLPASPGLLPLTPSPAS